MLGPIARLLRVASLAICLIVIASFAIFVVDESKSASARQTQQITGQPAATGSGGSGSTGKSSAKPSSVHKVIDEASEQLTSPFAGVVSGASSEWAIRGVKLLLALAVYGFGLGYLARVLRVRA